jgi:hypothetical protein
MVGAVSRVRSSMTFVVKSTVVSAVCRSVRWFFRAMARHSGKISRSRLTTRAGIL